MGSGIEQWLRLRPVLVSERTHWGKHCGLSGLRGCVGEFIQGFGMYREA